MHGTLALLDDEGIVGELALREARSGAWRWSRCGAVPSRCARSSTAAARSEPGVLARTARSLIMRVALLCPDLLFGSKLQGALLAAGHEPVAAGDEAELLVVDLTDDADARIEQSAQAGVPRLGFYSHVEQDVRRRAEEAGFDRVVPRSRMAREAAALVESML